MDLTIIIPVFNEVESITSLLDEIAAQFDETPQRHVQVAEITPAARASRVDSGVRSRQPNQ